MMDADFLAYLELDADNPPWQPADDEMMRRILTKASEWYLVARRQTVEFSDMRAARAADLDVLIDLRQLVPVLQAQVDKLSEHLEDSQIHAATLQGYLDRKNEELELVQRRADEARAAYEERCRFIPERR